MDMVTPFAPNPGDAQPGNLYADLGTRTLWLGVEAVVDPAQAVLISDIVGLQASIAAGDASARAYLRRHPDAARRRGCILTPESAAQISSSCHNTPQIVTTAFVRRGHCEQFQNWVRGMIMQYSGLLSDIGVGGLAGWSLCDGSNGTPDLRERFVLGCRLARYWCHECSNQLRHRCRWRSYPHRQCDGADAGADTERTITPVPPLGATLTTSTMSHGNTGNESADHSHEHGCSAGSITALLLAVPGRLAVTTRTKALIRPAAGAPPMYHFFNVQSGGEMLDHCARHLRRRQQPGVIAIRWSAAAASISTTSPRRSCVRRCRSTRSPSS